MKNITILAMKNKKQKKEDAFTIHVVEKNENKPSCSSSKLKVVLRSKAEFKDDYR